MAFPVYPAGVDYKPDLNSFRVLEAYRPPELDGVRGWPSTGPAQVGHRSSRSSGLPDLVPHPCRFRRLQGVRGERPRRRHVALHDAGLSARDQLVRDQDRDDRRGQVTADTFGLGFAASFTLLVFDW